MQYRTLGKTGLPVSLVGMGGIPIQKVDAEKAEQVVLAAIKAGINFFDTARGYTDSEEKLGRVLACIRGVSPDLIIATKSTAKTKADILQDVEISLQNLQVKSIDLYQLHNVKDQATLDTVMSPGGAVEGLKEAKAKGLIRHIGITGHVPEILIKAIKTGEFATVQFPFNAVEQEAVQVLLPLAVELGLGVIVMKPLAGGAFTKPDLALRFLFEYPVTTVIPGMESLEQVTQNSSLGKAVQPLTPVEKEELQVEVQFLGKTFCRRCEYCLPCPQKVNIPLVFTLDSYLTRYGLQGWAEDRYQGMEKKAKDCAECGLCEERCPYSLPIRKMLKEASGRFDRE